MREFSKSVVTDTLTHRHTGPITLPLRKSGVLKVVGLPSVPGTRGRPSGTRESVGKPGHEWSQ